MDFQIRKEMCKRWESITIFRVKGESYVILKSREKVLIEVECGTTKYVQVACSLDEINSLRGPL